MVNGELLRRTCVQLVMGALLLVGLALRSEAAGWTPLVRLAPDFPGTAMLGRDGRVYVWGGAGNVMVLTPDATGSYINGSWSLISLLKNTTIGPPRPAR